MNIKYILTTNDFFLQGPCGRVSHAKGFVEGLALNGKNVTIVSTVGADKFINKSDFINFQFFNFSIFLFYEILISIFLKDKIVIRWSTDLSFLFFPFLCFYKNI